MRNFAVTLRMVKCMDPRRAIGRSENCVQGRYLSDPMFDGRICTEPKQHNAQIYRFDYRSLGSQNQKIPSIH
jgi:hypothetical protein